MTILTFIATRFEIGTLAGDDAHRGFEIVAEVVGVGNGVVERARDNNASSWSWHGQC